MSKKYDDDDIARFGRIIADEIKSEFRLGFESLDFIKAQVSHIPAMRDDIAELKADMKTVKQAIRATNRDFKGTNLRVTKLETIAHTH